MKKVLNLFLFFFLWSTATQVIHAADSIFVRETRIPILIERQDNALFYIRLNAGENQTLDNVVLNFGKEVKLSDIQAVKLYYGGTEALQDRDKKRFAPVEYISSHKPGGTLAANPSYSIKNSEVNNPGSEVLLNSGQKLFPGVNFFWISLQMNPGTRLDTKVTAKLTSVTLDGKKVPLKMFSPEGIEHRMGVGVRHAGDDNSAAFRIPGLVTTNKGTLLGVYDVRYNSSVDLQEHVDVGLSRSTDGGKTWEKCVCLWLSARRADCLLHRMVWVILPFWLTPRRTLYGWWPHGRTEWATSVHGGAHIREWM